MLFVHIYHEYHSTDRDVCLGRASKMGKILNMKKQENFKFYLTKSKDIKKKKKL